MASTPLALTLLTLTPFLFLLTPQTQAQNTPTAPSPAPAGPVNLTGILDKGGQYTTFIRLLNETQQITPLESQLNNTSEGFTVFAPTDNAFQNLQSGAINDLTDQQKVQLILYHISPKYYSQSDLQTVSNPVRTQASGKDGTWGLNFTAQGNQLNVSSGVVATPINNALRQQFPLAVYQVDKVLLPLELFRAKSPASAPSSQPSKSTPSNQSSSNTGNGGGAPSPSNNSQKRDASGRNVGLGLVLGLGFICMGALS